MSRFESVGGFGFFVGGFAGGSDLHEALQEFESDGGAEEDGEGGESGSGLGLGGQIHDDGASFSEAAAMREVLEAG